MDGAGGWHDFLERMRHPSAAEFVKSIKSFIVSFTNKARNPEKDIDAVQEFLAKMEAAFRVHSLWAGCSEEELDSAGEGLEKYVMTKLFNCTFASLPEERKHDEELYEKMSCIQQFIRPENLDIKPNFQNETSWLLAQKELQKINLYKAPRDKLVCILNCCKVINNLLLNVSLTSSENPPGADEFLPVLIYVTIKANPPQLHSNLLYIQQYRCRTRLVSEAAYYFTNILSAESFIWNIDAEALSMDEIEFQKSMESARTLILGMPTDVEGQAIPKAHHPTSRSSSEIQDDGRDRTIIKDSGSSQSIRVNYGQHQSSDSSRELDGMNTSAACEQSVSALVSKGANNLLKEEPLSKYFIEYPFIYASAGDLTVKDVEALLNSYKKLVLKYVSLSKGMENVNPSRPLFSAEKLADTEKSKEGYYENDNEPDDIKGKGTSSQEHADSDVVENSKSLSKGMENVNPSLTLFSAEKLADTEKSKEQYNENDKEPVDVKGKGTNSQERADGDVVENSKSLSKGMKNVSPWLPFFSAENLADIEKSEERCDGNGKELDDVKGKGTNSEEHGDGDVAENSIGNTFDEVDNISYNIHMVEPSKDTSEKSEQST